MRSVITVAFLFVSLSLYAQEGTTNNDTKENNHTTFYNFHKPTHSVGLLVGGNFSFIESKQKNTVGNMETSNAMFLSPQLTLKYSCIIKNGWGITVEVPFGSFYRNVIMDNNTPKDTVWSNGVTGKGENNYLGFNTYYSGISLKASHVVSVHKNISLQSEMGLKWLPFIASAKDILAESPIEYTLSDGTETDKLVYMNLTPSVSNYAIPDFAFSFNVLVHSKNPAHNFVFGINGNISFVDRIHFNYQTTDILPTYLQSSGEFGWRTSSIGLHIGYQWMSGTKK
ncbi:MAG: hypothetical protein GX330_07245 [Bacteroidales bacterium]|nr:hypothetical protein [Bacteroidales bacterium]